MDGDAGHEPDAAHVPITPELLADLQAGLLDDATAAELRQRVRTDTAAAEMLAALDRVRRDLADLGTDDASAPDVPAEVTARVGTALQAAPPHRPPREPAHSVRHTPRWQVVGLVAGVGAAVVGVVRRRADADARPCTDPPGGADGREHHGVAAAVRAPVVGSPDRRPAVTEPRTTARSRTRNGVRPACRTGLLGGHAGAGRATGRHARAARGAHAAGRRHAEDARCVLVVEPNCNSAHTGLLANTLVTRP